jgi:hypothetical protein
MQKEIILLLVWEYRGMVCELKKAESEGVYSLIIDERNPMFLPLEKSLLDMMLFANKIIDYYLSENPS